MPNERVKEILKERAIKLRSEKKEEQKHEEFFWGLEFLLDKQHYIIETKFVSEVITIKHVTTLPCTPKFIRGIINIRGKIISLINLSHFLSKEEKELPSIYKVIVLSMQEYEFGIWADEILGSVKVKENTIKPAQMFELNNAPGLIRGITPESKSILSIEKLIENNQIIVNDQIN